MAELTFNSPGVSLREIDYSTKTAVVPTGTPAGVIGTAVRGPAFVPVTVPTFTDFVAVFGNSDGKKFGPIAVNEWLRNAGSLTYVRTLGAGDAKARSTSGVNAGRVNNAGFVVGSQQVQPSGLVGRNPYNGASSAAAVGPLGRTYFLAAFMSESAGSTVFSSAGLQTSANAVPIIRGVLMAPSGVVLSLSSNLANSNNTVPASLSYGVFGSNKDAGGNIGSISLAGTSQEFVMYLNGLKNSDRFLNTITASLDPQAGNYFANVLNSDPTKIEQAGHCLYARYDIVQSLAVVTGTGLISAASKIGGCEPSVLLLTSSAPYNSGSISSATSVGIPNFEGFEDRYTAAFTPYVVSQKFGGTPIDLFRFLALSDGEVGSKEVKVTISNIAASSKASYKYGTFDIQVRRFADSDADIGQYPPLETFVGCTLDPSSDRYVAKLVGDMHMYYDFDQPTGKQRMVVEGDYPNRSQYVRIELSQDLKNGAIDPTALPTGFRGVYHLLTAANSVVSSNGAASILTGSFSNATDSETSGIRLTTLQLVSQPPIPLRESLATGLSPKKVVNSDLTWGVQFELKDSTTEPNANNIIDSSLLSFGKYFPIYHTSFQNPYVGNNAGVANIGSAVLDADRFNNNFFTLERVEVITSSNDVPDEGQWSVAAYRRNGVAAGTLTDKDGNTGIGSRFLNPAKDFSDIPTQAYLKFTLPFQGGFDGVNIFDSDKSSFSNNAVLREMIDITNQFGTSGPTVAAYRKAIDVLKNKTDSDIQILAIPGIRDPGVSNYAISAVENRFDAMYVMDIEYADGNALVITGSSQNVSVINTTNRLKSRGLDTSFAAAYFPDVTITDPASRLNVTCPPSVAVLGALSLNDAIGYPWFAPAGFSRGALVTTLNTVPPNLNQSNLDTLYSADINPIASGFRGVPQPVIFGQKTLQAAQTALDRVNVRRLLIDIRRRVKNVANNFIFEPNRASTLGAFNAAVTPIMATIQQQQGVERFSVKIDTSTTTQADVENNTIRGKIYLQPTKSVEFVSLDFVVSNNGEA
jgi:hypothetical protein